MYDEYQEGDESYCYDAGQSGFFEQNLVQALDAGVRQTVNEALAKAITPLKHHLYEFVQQQGWIPSSVSMIEGTKAAPATLPNKDAHFEVFEMLAASLANEHSHSIPSEPRLEAFAEDSDGTSSESSSQEGTQRPRKRKAKTHHTTSSKQPKLLTFEPGEIIHPRSTAWVPPPGVVDYVKSHIRQDFEVRARLRSVSQT
ncbi:hypothetical protein NDU88_006032 [Pleurodeles waltl]|uniref:Uncharacterized protein n=1 Tax=Pleurodeles waltl TaxID=8319 RepID=A0AAV7LMZ3_PLEWA|nr:hypothetical protein NDU88_006032 [Pleurodeles waltl]